MDGNGFGGEAPNHEGIPATGPALDAEATRAVKVELDRFRGALRRAMAAEGRGALAGFVNHSGGAVGSDHAWDVESKKFGAVSKHWFRGARTPFGNAPMSDADFLESEETAQAAARRMCRSWSRNPWVQNLVRRNWCQAKYADAVYAVGHIQWERTRSPAPVQVRGGTGYAVQMALDIGKPVWVFNLDDGKWHDALDGWAETESPVLAERFAGIGTRGDAVPGRPGATKLPNAAWEAIRDVCEKTATMRSTTFNSFIKIEHNLNLIHLNYSKNDILYIFKKISKIFEKLSTGNKNIYLQYLKLYEFIMNCK